MSSSSELFFSPRPEPFHVPRTQHEISAAALDGDPLTGLEVQTAFDGNPVDTARLRVAFDGNATTSQVRLHNGADRIRQRTSLALDGDPLSRSDFELGRDALAWLERRAPNMATPHTGLERRARPMPTPWDHPKHNSFEY